MRRSEARILTTHVGRLIRPAELLQLGAVARQHPDNETRCADALQRVEALAEGARIASSELWG